MKGVALFMVCLMLTGVISPLIIGSGTAADISDSEGYAPLKAGHIEGIVLDSDGDPVDGATVTFDGGSAETTDEKGLFSRALPPGDYDVAVSKAGHSTATVHNITVGDTIEITIVPRGWHESGDAFEDGWFSDSEIYYGSIRLSVDVDPLLPVNEWFFASANDYKIGSNWAERNDNKGFVWYVDIDGDGTFSNKGNDPNYQDWEIVLDQFTLNNRGIPIADFDNDGDYDLVVPNIWYDGSWHNDEMQFVENLGPDGDGHRVFAAPVNAGVQFSMSNYHFSGAVADYNNDGDWDFIGAGNNDNLFFCRGNGDGTFDRFTITLDAPDSRNRGKSAGDINNDGNADLVVVTNNDGWVYAYYGDGNGNFDADPTYLFTAYSQRYGPITYRDPYGLTIADFNNDGTADIITNDGSPALYSLWIGDGAGNFERQDPSLFDFGSHGALDAFDVDQDGDMDLVIIEHYGGGRIYAAINIGDGASWSTKEVIKYNSGSSGQKNTFGIVTPPTVTTFETSGAYVSDIHDTVDANSEITLVDYTGGVNANQSMTVQVRSAPDILMAGASAWEDVDVYDNTITTPSGRYIQYRVLLSGTGMSSPVLRSIDISYQTSPAWITGTVTNEGGYPVPGAVVRMETGGLTAAGAVCDASGDYRIGVSAGAYTLRVEAEDHNPYWQDVNVVGNAVLDLVIRFKNVLFHTTVDDFGTGSFTNTFADEQRGAVTLASNIARDMSVFGNSGEWADWHRAQLVDGRYDLRYHATVNAPQSAGYKNSQWIAVDLGSQRDIASIDYYMSYDSRYWQSGFAITAYTGYDAPTETFSGGTELVNFTKGTWTTAADCPDRFTFEQGAVYNASSGAPVSGWLPGTSSVTARYVRVHEVYGNYTNSDTWHYYRIAEMGVHPPSLSGEYVSEICNTTNPNSLISAVQWHADVPPGTTMDVYLRSGDDEAGILTEPWVPVEDMDHDFGSVFEGDFIQYRVVMNSTDGASTPALRDISIHYYEDPAWMTGTVTQKFIGTLIPLARVDVQQQAGLLSNVTVLTGRNGSYIAPVECSSSGPLLYDLVVSKAGYQDETGVANITQALPETVADIELNPNDDWTQMGGNADRTSSTAIPGQYFAPGVEWKSYIGGYAEWGVIYDVNKDNRNDIVMLYGQRVVAKTPDDVLLWVGDTSDVDKIIGIYDLDKNGIVDIVAAKRYPARISIINGVNGSLQYEKTWTAQYLHSYAPDNIIVDDFDGAMDGKYEMIIKLNDGRLRAWKFKTVGWRAVPETMWDISYAYDSKNSIAVGDVDLDGVKDVVVLTAYRISVYNAEDGSFKYDDVISSAPYRVGGSLIITDLNKTDGRGNVIVIHAEPNHNWYKNNDVYTYDGVMVMECNESTIGVRSHYVIEQGSWGNQILFEWMQGCIADVDGDGVLEFVGNIRNISSAARSAGRNHWYCIIVDLNNGTLEGTFGSPKEYQWESRAIANIDDDPEYEIILWSDTSSDHWVALDGNETGYHEKWNVSGYQDAYWNRWFKAQHEPAECWFSSGQYYWEWYQVYGPNAYGDIDGDGMNEIFLLDQGNFSAFNANGSSLERVWNFIPPPNVPTPRIYMRDIGNLTGDDVNEAIIATDDGYMYVVNETGIAKTIRTGGSTTNLWSADMDQDGDKEIIAHLPHETWITMLNASGADYHNEPISYPLHHLHQDTHFLIDYDNDGRIELITKNWGNVYCYEWDGVLNEWDREWRFRKRDIWNGRERLYAFSSLTVGYFNSDNIMDIYFQYNNYSYSQPNEWSTYVTGSMVLDGATQIPFWVKDGTRVRYGIVHDVDDDGLDEILSQDGTTFRIFDPLIGEFTYTRSNPPTYSYGGQMIGQADYDLAPELLVAYQFYSRTVIGSAIDIETGEVLWYGGDVNESTYRVESTRGTAVDVDGDGIDEVVQTMVDGRAYCIDDDGSVVWNFDLDNEETVLTQPTAADLDSDGIPEIIFGASNGYMYVLDGNNGSIDWTFHFGFGSAQPIVIDIDNDDQGEIIISVGDGYIYCLDNVNSVELRLRDTDVESVVNQPDGNTVVVGVNVRNEGGITADNVVVRFEDNDVVFHETNIDIGPGSVEHLDVVWTASPVGNHTINISVDPDDLIPELDETNNNFTRTIYVWPVPDMMIANTSKWDKNEDVAFGIGPILGYENRLDITIHNLGPVIAENFNINLTDNNRTVDSILVTLGAYENGSYSLYWTPVTDVENLTHTLEIWIDKENRIFESNEWNNHVILKARTFGPPPEIQIRREDITLDGNIEMPDDRIGVIEGDKLKINCTLRNKGFLVAAYVGVLIYIDTNMDHQFNPRKDVYINLDPLYNEWDRWSRAVEIIPSYYHNWTIEQTLNLRINTAPLRSAIFAKTGKDDLTAYPLCISIDPTNIIPEKNNINFVVVGNLLVIPTKPEVSIERDDIILDYLDTTVVRKDADIIVKVRNLGASQAVNVTVELSDLGVPIGSTVVNVPCVTMTRPYDEAYAIAEFTYGFSGEGEHVLHVRLDYPGEEALSVQTNNNATLDTKAVGTHVDTPGFSTAWPVVTVLALLCAFACSRRREDDRSRRKWGTRSGERHDGSTP